MPCYNAAGVISDAIASVMAQTYQNWELIVVDDCSTDSSAEVIKSLATKDSRIKLFRTNSNSGSATTPRNIGIDKADGEYIAFLDADDLWTETKLEKQLEVFKKEQCAIVFADYYKTDYSEGLQNNRIVKAPERVTYQQMLSGNEIGCLTAVYSVEKVGKRYFKNIGHEDYLLWLDILRGGETAVNTCEPLAYYRTGRKSLSSNKFKAMKWTWHILYKEEKLSFFKAFKHFTLYAVKGVLKSSK